MIDRIKQIALLTTTLVAVGCGANPTAACEDYIAAVNTCYEEAGVDAPVTDSFCSAYDGTKGKAAKEAADLLTCYADTIDGGDCSTAEGAGTAYSAITTECL